MVHGLAAIPKVSGSSPGPILYCECDKSNPEGASSRYVGVLPPLRTKIAANRR